MLEATVERRVFPAAPWVLCSHALQQMSKGIGWHLAQGALVVGYFVAVLFTQYSALRVGAAGLDLFERVTYLNLVFITIAGVACFSVCVTNERESGTLDLLRLSGLGPVGFLVGKWLPLLLGCALLLVLQVPCTSFAVTLGGVLPGQIRAMTVMSLVHLFLVASIGLLISVISKTSQRAVLSSVVVFGVWFSGPAAFTTVIRWLWPAWNSLAADHFLELLRSASAFGNSERLFGSYQTAPALWSMEQTGQMLVGIAALGLSWLLFERCGETVPVIATRSATRRPRRRWGTGAMALFWKDFHLTAGGWRWFVLRLLLYPIITLSYGIIVSATAGDPFLTWAITHELTLRMVGWDTAIVLAQLFQREVREQTWDTLRLLPHSHPTICYSKLAGAFWALSPGWIWMTYASITVASFGSYGATTLDIVFFASIVVVGCHVTTFVSVLFPRFTWTVALLLGVVAAQLELEFARSLVFAMGFGLPTGSLIASLLLMSVVISAGLHGLIAWRIRSLGD